MGLKLPNLLSGKIFSNGFDSIFTIAMILFGMAGCLYVLYIQNSSHETLSDHVVLTASITNPVPEAKPAVAIPMTNRERPNYVHINGPKKAKVPMYFEIDAFDPAAVYEFDFGKGKKVKASGQITEHTFSKAGAHQVTLTVSYNNESRVIDLGAVWIQ